ncbi:SAV_6107 family HEPN domain-containing protein [Nocardioides sp.]|uniref:SAV_6107 family HEPN domain-containing protein n=1 Tax=Nocardioides sp. TaxID=35761 RepID=UPI00260A6E12|nr:SAV_6107 family HEPN domain-containing protein [Nocardioides sp.]
MTTDDRQLASFSAGPTFLPATTHVYLVRAAESLDEALASSDPAVRFANAHVAALRAAAAWLAARTKPAAGKRRSRNAWVLLAASSDEMADWATYFSAGAGKRAAAEAGSASAVTAAEADTLLEAADRFLGVVEESLGVTSHAPVTGRIRNAG